MLIQTQDFSLFSTNKLLLNTNIFRISSLMNDQIVLQLRLNLSTHSHTTHLITDFSSNDKLIKLLN